LEVVIIKSAANNNGGASGRGWRSPEEAWAAVPGDGGYAYEERERKTDADAGRRLNSLMSDGLSVSCRT
jgi:hypothetical protein